MTERVTVLDSNIESNSKLYYKGFGYSRENHLNMEDERETLLHFIC